MNEERLASERTYYGAITMFYREGPSGREFLVVKNAKTGNISFVSGAQEEADPDLLETARREISEELGIPKEQYELQEIDAKHEFVFGPNKKERAGQKGSYQVFAANLTGIDYEGQHTEELTGAVWMSEADVLESLTFPDLKEVFQRAIVEI